MRHLSERSMSDTIEDEIQEIFNDELCEHTGLAAGDEFRLSYASSSVSSQISTLGELFAEYFLRDPNESNDIDTFLKSNQLNEIINEKQFMQLMCGEACLSQEALEFFRLKLPFEVTSNKMHALNVKAKCASPHIEMLKLPKEEMLKFSSDMRKQKLAESKKRISLSKMKYNRAHRLDILARLRWRYHNDEEYQNKVRQKSKKTYDNLSEEQREKMYAQQREKYNSDEDYRKNKNLNNHKNYLVRKERMAKDPEYAAEVRKKQREQKRLYRAALKLKKEKSK